MMNEETLKKYDALRRILKDMEGVVVGFSGGVDSTFLTYAAHDVLGERALAATALSPTLPAEEEEEARKIAAEIGVRHILFPSLEFEDEEFVKNQPDRCYICKKIRFTALAGLAEKEGLPWVADGSNVDDLGDFRPGLQALKELSRYVRSPMVEAGLRKDEIRRLSRMLGLPTWNKQSAACLASRIPYGTELLPERLRQVGEAEAWLSSFVCGSLRVRHHGDVARIEVSPEDIPAIIEKRQAVAAAMRRFGFTYAALDLRGYEMGSLNETIRTQEEE